jgi:hypothetical protein
MGNIFVFLGPTISKEEAREILPSATFLDPVSQGDISNLIKYNNPDIIAIIDGYFESVPSVWHKEILEALKEGIQVYGSSSMGALRAAELDGFGMIGVGEIYKLYANGLINDDDEVAVLHGPKEMGYPSCSDALVNIRKTLQLALDVGVIDENSHAEIIKTAKNTFYKERLYFDIVSNSQINQNEKEHLLNWISNNSINLKKEDALTLLREIGTVVSDEKNIPKFHFNKTIFWQKSRMSLNENQ